jgi:hypothetical protein
MSKLYEARAVREAYAIDFGAGFNWFDHLGSGGFYGLPGSHYHLDDAVCPDLSDGAAWDSLLAGVEKLGIRFLRFGIPPDPHFRSGRFTRDTVHLRRLERINAWACLHGVTILLDPFLIPWSLTMDCAAELEARHGHKQVQPAARDNEEIVRDFYLPLIRHVVDDLRLESVRLFNCFNEPFCYGCYDTPAAGPDKYRHYVDMYRRLRTALIGAGILPQRLGLVGMDITFWGGWQHISPLLQPDNDLGQYIDHYSVHFYQLSFDYLPMTVEREGKKMVFEPMSQTIDTDTLRLAGYCRSRGKGLIAPEVGTFRYGWRPNPPGAASYEANLTTAEGVIRLANVGVSTTAFWSLMNPNNIDGHWRTLGIHLAGDHKGSVFFEKWPALFKGLLCQVFQPGRTVSPLETGFVGDPYRYVHATRVRGADCNFVLAVNDHPTESRRLVLAGEAPFPPTLVQVTPSQTRRLAQNPNGDASPWDLPPMSLSVWAQMLSGAGLRYEY